MLMQKDAQALVGDVYVNSESVQSQLVNQNYDQKTQKVNQIEVLVDRQQRH